MFWATSTFPAAVGVDYRKVNKSRWFDGEVKIRQRRRVCDAKKFVDGTNCGEIRRRIDIFPVAAHVVVYCQKIFDTPASTIYTDSIIVYN